MAENTEGRFKIKKITKFSQLAEGEVLELPESDLCFQNEERIIQMKYANGAWEVHTTPCGQSFRKLVITLGDMQRSGQKLTIEVLNLEA